MTNKAFIQYRRRAGVVFVAAIIAIAVFAVGSLLLQKPVNMGNSQAGVPAEGQVKIKGTLLCLPHTNTSGPQTDECAYGLKDEQGRYYGIRDTDPTYRNISAVPINETVEVTGTFNKATGTTYPTIGTIEVTKITH